VPEETATRFSSTTLPALPEDASSWRRCASHQRRVWTCDPWKGQRGLIVVRPHRQNHALAVVELISTNHPDVVLIVLLSTSAQRVTDMQRSVKRVITLTLTNRGRGHVQVPRWSSKRKRLVSTSATCDSARFDHPMAAPTTHRAPSGKSSAAWTPRPQGPSLLGRPATSRRGSLTIISPR